MDCTSNNSAKLQPVDNGNKLVDIDVNDDCRGGFVNNVDDDDVGRVSKATTSGSSSSNPKELGKDIHDDRSQPSSPTTMMMMIAKGKRTKRQRLRSRININNASSQEEEDEEQLDMANCLILLAQGHSRPSSSPSKQSGTKRLSSHNKRCYGSSVAGVYECNTCNRIFSSFQALGGHRASHKKLKITAVDAKHFPAINSPTPLATVLSLQLGNINYSRAPPTTAAVVVQNHNSDVKSRNRIHECSICGAEFSSGQALGGHMRRHRGTIIPLNSSTNNNPITNTTLSLSTAVIAVEFSAKVNRMNTSNDDFLSLDLNLPASPSPEDHDHTKFSFAPKQPQPQQEQQQSAMAFSTPALVDCFY